MIEKVCTIDSIRAVYGVVRVSLASIKAAVNVTTGMDRQIFHNVHLRVSHNDRSVHNTLLHTSQHHQKKKKKKKWRRSKMGKRKRI